MFWWLRGRWGGGYSPGGPFISVTDSNNSIYGANPIYERPQLWWAGETIEVNVWLKRVDADLHPYGGNSTFLHFPQKLLG